MNHYSLIISASLLLLTSEAKSEFIGQLQFIPDGCEISQKCTLKFDFGYIDPMGVGWVTVAGDPTDGASIPDWARPFIGIPFEHSYIKAAVIHDHYCNRHVRPESQTHRVFYDAMIEGGVPPLKAKLMYYAVVVGATHWKELIPGKPCQFGNSCIQNIGGVGNLHGGKIMLSSNGQKLLVWPQTYDTLEFKKDLQQVEVMINEIGNTITPDDIVNIAKSRHPNVFYLRTGDSIPFQDDTSSFPHE